MVGAEDLYKHNALYETFHDISPGRKPIRVVLDAPLEPEIELSGVV